MVGPYACCADGWPLMMTCTAGRPLRSMLAVAESRKEGANQTEGDLLVAES
jgi:hypothetical protein